MKKIKDCIIWNHASATIGVKIIPNSKKAEFVGFLGDDYKIKLKSIPEKGKANRELMVFLSKHLSIPQKNITILSGESSQNKTILLTR